MTESQVSVEYRYTEAEYLAASRLFFFKSPNILVRVIGFSLFLIAGAVMISVVVEVDFLVVSAAVAFVILLEGALFYNILVRIPRSYFRGDRKFRHKFNVTFSDGGITVKTSKIDSKYAWSLYTKVLEGQDMYLLVYGKETRMTTPVPKRAFKSRAQEDQFRELIARHLSDHSRLKQTPPAEYIPTSLTPPDWR